MVNCSARTEWSSKCEIYFAFCKYEKSDTLSLKMGQHSTTLRYNEKDLVNVEEIYVTLNSTPELKCIYDMCDNNETMYDVADLKTRYATYAAQHNLVVRKAHAFMNTISGILASKKSTSSKNRVHKTYYTLSKPSIIDCIDKYLLTRVKVVKMDNNIPRAFFEIQSRVNAFIKKANLGVFKYNSQINNGLETDHIPDFLFDLPTHAVIVEVDEEQHRRCGKEKEEIRMIDIAKALKKKTIFIRFNPDKYIVKRVTYETPLEERLITLGDALKYYLSISTTNENYAVTARYLYFNNLLNEIEYLVLRHFPVATSLKSLASSYEEDKSDTNWDPIANWVNSYEVEKNLENNPLMVAMSTGDSNLIQEVINRVYNTITPDIWLSQN